MVAVVSQWLYLLDVTHYTDSANTQGASNKNLSITALDQHGPVKVSKEVGVMGDGKRIAERRRGMEGRVGRGGKEEE